jgi:FAD/FMN-containing dehydrogenase
MCKLALILVSYHSCLQIRNRLLTRCAAKANNIRLIVKNSGHDYVGRSSGSNALSIWVHHMKGITIHETGFQPQHCNLVIDGVAITAGGGTQMLEAYRETAAINYTVVGGGGRTVALGGFLTGAGHSILSPHYGLATDQVLEMEIVTPTGDHLVLNECQNTDLFWAMRGVSLSPPSPKKSLPKT